MKITKIYLTSSLLFLPLLVGCQQQPSPETRMEIAKLSFPSVYKLVEFNSDWDVGESVETYTLIIPSSEYQRIRMEIENKSFFQYVKNAKSRPTVYLMMSDMKKLTEVAYWFEGEYAYQIYSPDPGAVVTVTLRNDSLLDIGYVDL